MKVRSSVMLLFCLCLGMMWVSSSSCNRKSGCPAYEQATTKANRKGQLSTKGGKSELFPKKMKRKMK